MYKSKVVRKMEIKSNYPMIRLNIDQQSDEVKDIETYIVDLHPVAVVELQSQQVRRLIYFAKKGIRAHKEYKARLNPQLSETISINEAED